MQRLSLLTAGALALIGTQLAPTATAQAIDTVRIVGGMSAPLYVTGAPGESRLFVLEQNTARIQILDSGVITGTFLDVNPLASSGGERGLLGLAFHPEYATNGYFFINYTNNAGATVVARYKRQNANQADPASAQILLTIAQPFANHNGGCLQFGPDGYLYIGMGDGGSANDPSCFAQNNNSLLGKMLRIDIDTIDATGTYGIPATNPFVGVPGFRPEIFMTGLRNPWRFSFDRKTGEMWIGDVGQNAWEEIDLLPNGVGGQNLGWRIFEGNNCNGQGSCPATVPSCATPGGYTFPVFVYSHASSNCSVTGGYRYRGSAIPAIEGLYFFGDYCTGRTWTIEWNGVSAINFTNQTTNLAPVGFTLNNITSYGQDNDGELYIVDPTGGEIFKIVPTGPAAPAPSLSAIWQNLSISQGGTQYLELNAGAGQAGNLYFVLGSASGTTPGLTVDGQNLPLNFDTYFSLSLSSPNVTPFANTLGVLNPQGRASARVRVPAGVLAPTTVGLTFHHAYASIDLGGTVQFTSNAVPLTLVP
jgi:glucose/arabinose dehydrogenase